VGPSPSPIKQSGGNLGIRSQFPARDCLQKFWLFFLPGVQSNFADTEKIGHLHVGRPKQAQLSNLFGEFRTVRCRTPLNPPAGAPM
jgi:hypothetical protein